MRSAQSMLIAGCLFSLTPAWAEATGQQKIQASKSEFRVCADPDNLPFTNRRGEGFENRIAELLARAANQQLSYYWWPERRGFVSNTLNAWECDVIIGVPTHDGAVKTTRPYYCSHYVMVHRPGQGSRHRFLARPKLDRCVSAWSNAPPLWTCFCNAISIRSSISPTTITWTTLPAKS